jgi:hypothetical protein
MEIELSASNKNPVACVEFVDEAVQVRVGQTIGCLICGDPTTVFFKACGCATLSESPGNCNMAVADSICVLVGGQRAGLQNFITNSTLFTCCRIFTCGVTGRCINGFALTFTPHRGCPGFCGSCPDHLSTSLQFSECVSAAGEEFGKVFNLSASMDPTFSISVAPLGGGAAPEIDAANAAAPLVVLACLLGVITDRRRRLRGEARR